MDLKTARKILGVSQHASPSELLRAFRKVLKEAETPTAKRNCMEAWNVVTGTTPADQLPDIVKGQNERKGSQTDSDTNPIALVQSIFAPDLQREFEEARQNQSNNGDASSGAAMFYGMVLDKARRKLQAGFLALFLASIIPTYLFVNNFQKLWPIFEGINPYPYFLYDPWPEIEDWKRPWLPVLKECVKHYNHPWRASAGLAEFHPNSQMTNNRDGISAPPFPREGVEYPKLTEGNHSTGWTPETSIYWLGRSWQEIRVHAWRPATDYNWSTGRNTITSDWFDREFTTCELAAGFLYYHQRHIIRYKEHWWRAFGFITLSFALGIGLVYRSKSRKIDQQYDDFIEALRAR